MIGIAALLGAALLAGPQEPGSPVELSVYFGRNSDEVAPSAEELIELAAERIRQGRPVRIHIEGHTSRAGNADENQALSLRRAMAVRDALVANQVPDDVISVDALGERSPATPTADGEHEPLNDRVVVRAEF